MDLQNVPRPAAAKPFTSIYMNEWNIPIGARSVTRESVAYYGDFRGAKGWENETGEEERGWKAGMEVDLVDCNTKGLPDIKTGWSGL